jgi:hypothetical protein
MELSFAQAHLLGDSPDVMDVSMTFKSVIRYSRNRNTFITGIGGGQNGRENGSDFEFAPIRQVFVEMNNVFKAAPEITFWGGERFYRFGIDPMDYFWLDMSGYGAGVNISISVSASSTSPIWPGWITISLRRPMAASTSTTLMWNGGIFP